MAAARAALTEDDLRMLVKGPTADERALAAHKLCRAMDRDNLSRQELAQAHEILRLMAKDAAELVRRALAVTLKASPVLPRDVALKLARDMEAIAMPVLNFSPAFTEEDLIDIARSGGPARQVAIARRFNLPERWPAPGGRRLRGGGAAGLRQRQRRARRGRRCRRRSPASRPRAGAGGGRLPPRPAAVGDRAAGDPGQRTGARPSDRPPSASRRRSPCRSRPPPASAP